MFSAIMDLVFGIIWTTITILLYVSSQSSGKTDIMVSLPVFAIFGIWLIFSGIRKMVKRAKSQDTTQE